MIDPLVVGGGERFLCDDGVKRPLRLVEHQVATTGAILATYARVELCVGQIAGATRPISALTLDPVMAMFHVVVLRSGPEWDASRPLEEQSGWTEHASFMNGLVDSGFIVLGGPLVDEHRVVHAVEAESEEEIRATLARDPWSETHLRIDTIDPWTIRLDSRSG